MMKRWRRILEPPLVLHTCACRRSSSSSSTSSLNPIKTLVLDKIHQNPLPHPTRSHHFLRHSFIPSTTPPPTSPRRLLSTSSKQNNHQRLSEEDKGPLLGDETDGWEDEEEEGLESQAGDGGDGGGVVLQNLPWGDRVLSIAQDVLLQFGDDFKIFSFKITPRGYVYVRLDKLSNPYGCPAMEELESYSQEYKRRLDEVGAQGDIPDDLALEVSSPGAERILKVPDDLSRFSDMPMRVSYVEATESDAQQKDGVFFLDSLELETENCVWKLADVRENRDPQSKGRPLSRKRRDWRLKLPFELHRKITLYLD
ncbi:hypothetical protein Tsubulata_023221 [Turnera subulata]|uniref:DUF7912 domain-containing protein n=1 Tax=Turnera subulata TaxID=218843 RepID=A0A9Q0FJB9_9ROSI|nr:hypothetical protein Tsubulata_023221 [Turnera subulata]